VDELMSSRRSQVKKQDHFSKRQPVDKKKYLAGSTVQKTVSIDF